jgi:hypothetical protein
VSTLRQGRLAGALVGEFLLPEVRESVEIRSVGEHVRGEKRLSSATWVSKPSMARESEITRHQCSDPSRAQRGPFAAPTGLEGPPSPRDDPLECPAMELRPVSFDSLSLPASRRARALDRVRAALRPDLAVAPGRALREGAREHRAGDLPQARRRRSVRRRGDDAGRRGSPTALSRRRNGPRSGSTGRRSRRAARRYVRDALVGLVRLAEYEKQVVRPHERTLAKPKEDRLALLRGDEGGLRAVFLMTRAPSPRRSSTRRTPQLTATDCRRRAPRRVSNLRLRRPRRAPGSREERRGDHRRRPSPLRDRSRASPRTPPPRSSRARYKLCAIVDMDSEGLIVGRFTGSSRTCPTGDPCARCMPRATSST